MTKNNITGTTNESVIIGQPDGTAKQLYFNTAGANKPGIKFDSGLQYSNNGTTWLSVGNAEPVADLTALTALDDTVLSDGSNKFVLTLLDSFRLDTSSVAVVDDITIVATNSGTGRWLRNNQPSPYWSSQATWYVDAVAGYDENDGNTALTALKTFAEFRRRVEPTNIIATMTVNILTNLPAGDPIVLRTSGAQVTIIGAETIEYSGTVSAWTRDPATNDPGTVTDAGWTVADHLFRLVRFTSGAAQYCAAWILSDETGGAARLSDVSDIFSAYPSPGDTFKVITCPTVTLGDNRYNGTVRFQMLWTEWLTKRFTNYGAAELIECKVHYYDYGPFSSLTNCFGDTQCYGQRCRIYGGVYAYIQCRNEGTNILFAPVTIQSQIDGFFKTYAIGLYPFAKLSAFADIFLFGAFQNKALNIECDSELMLDDPVNVQYTRIRGDITGTAYLGYMYADHAKIITSVFDHTITGMGDGLYLYPDTIIMDINDGPILIPGSAAQVGTGTEFGASSIARAGIKGALPAASDGYALPDFTSSITDDLPIVVSNKSFARNLRAHLGTAPGGADTVVLTVNVDGVPSTLTLTFGAADTDKSDVSHNELVSPGQLISFYVENSGAVAADLSISLETG